MDRHSPEAASLPIRKIEPSTKNSLHDLKQELTSLAQLHLELLPSTASSKSGASAVEHLYRQVSSHPKGVVLTGTFGFASGCADLRSIEAQLKSQTPPSLFVKLAFFNLLSPGHIFSRSKWESLIPKESCGYILTMGAKPGGLRGHQFLSALENEFQKLSCQDSWVDTEENNNVALSFYQKNGYSLVDTAFGHCLLKKRL